MPDRRVVQPWATLFLDCFSRAIIGFAITETPSRESILAAMRAAIMVEPPFGPMGGVPLAIRVDRGRDFLAAAIRVAAAALVIDVRAAAAYAPQQKGAIERVNESVEQLLLSDLPGFLHGAKDRTGRPVGRDAPILPVQAFVELFARFVRWYHEERPHEGLNGRTPLEVWQSDPTPLRTVPASRLRHLLLVGEVRTVTTKGVQLDGRRYNAAELTGYVGETVEVRYMPHHDDEVEVFLKDRHLCTARLVSRMSPGDVRRLLERRAEEAKWLRQVTRAAERKRRVVYAAMTEPAPAVAASRVTEGAAVELTAYSDQDQRRLASRSLVDHGPIPTRMVRPLDGGAR
jgi:putative transposase